MQLYFLTVLLLQVFIYQIANSDSDSHLIREEWEEPNAWGRKKTVVRPSDNIFEMRQEIKRSDYNPDGVALVYYKKFISTLFNRDTLQFDVQRNHYCRSLIFDILPAELDELENVSDPRELDRILHDLLGNMRKNQNCLDKNYVRSSKAGLNFVGLIWDIFKDFWQLLKISEVQIALVIGSVIPCIWLVHRRSGFKGVILIIIGGSFAFGYFITYLECNRNKEIEEYMELLDDVDENVPTVSWTAKLANMFSWSSAKKQHIRQNLKKINAPKIPYCRPDHVLLLYMNDLFLKQLEFLIEKCTTTIEHITGRLTFPFNYLAPILLIYMICYMCMLTFKYVINPSSWASLLHGPPTNNYHIPFAHPTVSSAAQATEDRISGENLKALFNFLANTTATTESPITPSSILSKMSSVCEPVLEQLVEPKNTPPNTPDDSTDSAITTTEEATDSEISKEEQFSTQLEGEKDLNKVILEDDNSECLTSE